VPLNEATEMVASPEPQTAVIRRSAYWTTTVGLAITIGATTGPALGALSLSLSTGFVDLVSGAFLAGGAGGVGVGSLRYFSGKSEMMECFSETFAFS